MVGLKYFIQSNSVPEMKSVAGNTFNPPDTWKPYIAKGDYSGIITMEFNEFITAERSNDKEQARKEAVHLFEAVRRYLDH